MATKEKALAHTPHSLVGRTARAMFEAAVEGTGDAPPFLSISNVERERFERMAIAALSIALMEPVTA